MDKKIILLFLLVIFFSSTVFSADTITGYYVPTSIQLDKEISATGIFKVDGVVTSGELCSFYFLDLNYNIVDRASDQYTTGTGRFTMQPFKITEPTFKRGDTYQLISECGSASSDINFLVLQRESLAHLGSQEFDFLTEPENTDTAFIWGAILVIFIIIVFFVTYFYRMAKR